MGVGKLNPLLNFQLHPAGHEFVLPSCKYDLHKRSFIVRSLFNFLTDDFVMNLTKNTTKTNFLLTFRSLSETFIKVLNSNQ